MRSSAGRAVLAVSMVLAVLPGDVPEPMPVRQAAPEWVAGDAHVHAAGDSGLQPHVRCQGVSGGLDGCAEHLVRETLQRAKDNGARWVIFTEHGPWLGIKPTDKTACAPPFGWPCKTVPWIEHDTGQARRQWARITAAARRLSQEYGVRALMGQELGTAGHITILVSYLEHLPSQLKSWYPGDCAGVEAGHFGVYYTPFGLLDDTAFDCNESRYLRTVDEGAAWGAVNHPDNEDGGSRWFCWNEGDVSPKDNTWNPDSGGGARCATGVYEHPDEVQAIEIVSDQNMPSDISLRHLDALLLQGRQVALTGGGDAHTAAPEPQLSNNVRVGSLRIPLPPGISQEPGNDAKVGLSGRTYVPGDTIEPGDVFSPTDPDDPVRQAIKRGHTVASTGPLGLPTIGRKVPGDIVNVTGGAVTVRVDFREARVVQGDLAHPGERQRTREVTVNGSGRRERASRINVVIGRSGACRPGRNAAGSRCLADPDNRRVIRHEVTEAEREQGYAEISVPVPATLTQGFLRTETLFAPTERDERFQDGTRYAHGAFASPFHLRQAASVARFVGSWHGHNKGVAINADGTAGMTWRDYSQEGMVFIRVEARLQGTPTGVTGTVTGSDSATVRVGAPVRVEPRDRYSIRVHIGGVEPLVVCSPQAPPGHCGA